MKIKHSLVITSISGPNQAMIDYGQKSARAGWNFIVIGDKKSPADFHIEGCDFWSLERQKTMDHQLALHLPPGHYSRKNLGYLLAIQNGAGVIIETDDDNFPYPSFWTIRKPGHKASLIVNGDWVNIYRHFTKQIIWPRGFPLEMIHENNIPILEPNTTKIYAPIQQGLADENPDVDAVYRLVLPLPVKFKKAIPIVLGPGSYCPFNSQNTTWFPDAFPLMYLPSFCSFRMTDIWRSFVAQFIAFNYGWKVLFHSSTVWQERNDHNLINDFKDEFQGYTENNRIIRILQGLNYSAKTGDIGENMMKSYEALVSNGLIPASELDLLNSWLADLKQLKCI